MSISEFAALEGAILHLMATAPQHHHHPNADEVGLSLKKQGQQPDGSFSPSQEEENDEQHAKVQRHHYPQRLAHVTLYYLVGSRSGRHAKWPRTLLRKELVESSSPIRIGRIEIRRYGLLGTDLGLETFRNTESDTSSSSSSGILCRYVVAHKPLLFLSELPQNEKTAEAAAAVLQSTQPINLPSDSSPYSTSSTGGLTHGGSSGGGSTGLSGCDDSSRGTHTSSDSRFDDLPPPMLNGSSSDAEAQPRPLIVVAPWCVASVQDIHQRMLQRLPAYTVNLAATWNGLTGKFNLQHRGKIIDSMEELLHYFGAKPNVLFQAASCMDRALAANPSYGSNRKPLRCLVIACSLLACKNLEVELPSKLTVSKVLSEVTLQLPQLQELEIGVLSSLKFALQPVTLIEFTELYSSLSIEGYFHEAERLKDVGLSGIVALLTCLALRDHKLSIFSHQVLGLAIMQHAMDLAAASPAFSAQQHLQEDDEDGVPPTTRASEARCLFPGEGTPGVANIGENDDDLPTLRRRGRNADGRPVGVSPLLLSLAEVHRSELQCPLEAMQRTMTQTTLHELCSPLLRIRFRQVLSDLGAVPQQH